MPICDAALGQVVWREFDVDAVAHQDADAVAAHAARDRREHHVLGIIKLHFEKCVRLFINDDAGHFYKFFFHSGFWLPLNHGPD